MAQLTVPINVNLPENWLDLVIERVKQDGDFVLVTRCKDCKHRDPEDKKCDSGHFIRWQLPRDDDWFCADGERRSEDDTHIQV